MGPGSPTKKADAEGGFHGIQRAVVPLPTLLCEAAKRGDTREVKRLHEELHADVNCTDLVAGLTPLHHAVECGTTATARYLLNNGANPNFMVSRGTPLFPAVYSGSAKMVALLLRRGADPRAVCGMRRTALHWAAHMGHTDVAKLLLAAGADVNAADQLGFTPLHMAVVRKHTDTAVVLLDSGANPNTACTDAYHGEHRTPLASAIVNDDFLIAVALVLRGADVDA